MSRTDMHIIRQEHYSLMILLMSGCVLEVAPQQGCCGLLHLQKG